MKRLLLLLLLFPFSVYGGAPLSATAVQTAVGGTGGAAANSFTVTLGSTPTQYNTLIAVVSTNSGAVWDVSQTRVIWRQVATTGYNATGPNVSRIYSGNIVSASAGTVITFTVFTGSNAGGVSIVAEYTGQYLYTSAVSTPATGNSASPSSGSITPGTPPSLIVACLTNRGTWSTQTTVYSSPTNGFSLASQQNTTSNSANNDRSVAMLVKLVTDQSATSAGATITSAQWSGVAGSFTQSQSGFFIP
jgi:hypothetical protein